MHRRQQKIGSPALLFKNNLSLGHVYGARVAWEVYCCCLAPACLMWSVAYYINNVTLVTLANSVHLFICWYVSIQPLHEQRSCQQGDQCSAWQLWAPHRAQGALCALSPKSDPWGSDSGTGLWDAGVEMQQVVTSAAGSGSGLDMKGTHRCVMPRASSGTWEATSR